MIPLHPISNYPPLRCRYSNLARRIKPLSVFFLSRVLHCESTNSRLYSISSSTPIKAKMVLNRTPYLYKHHRFTALHRCRGRDSTPTYSFRSALPPPLRKYSHRHTFNFKRTEHRSATTQVRPRPRARIATPSVRALGEALSRCRALSKAYSLWGMERDVGSHTGDFFLRLHLLRHKPRRIFGFWEGSLGSKDIWAVRKSDPVVYLPCSDGGYPWTYV